MFCTRPDRRWGSTQPPTQRVSRHLRVKRPGRGLNHSPHLVPWLELYLHSRSVPSWHVTGWIAFLTLLSVAHVIHRIIKGKSEKKNSRTICLDGMKKPMKNLTVSGRWPGRDTWNRYLLKPRAHNTLDSARRTGPTKIRYRCTQQQNQQRH
jgi:hypothetical protein